MPLMRWWQRAQSVAGAPGVRQLSVGREEWTQVARDVAATGGVLQALWVTGAPAEGAHVYGVYLTDPGGLAVELALPAGDAGPYPGLQELFPAASRLQRAAFDLSGVRSSDPDVRPWLEHAEPYPFTRVDGEGVHEIAVGPVHAGTIEPGHFRFSVVGEKVLRLEAHLGYVHRGLEQRFRELPILAGHRLAARISGDSAVAFSWAYCQALEGLAGSTIPARAAWLRAVCLELERLANHLGDLGALGNDAGFAFGLAQFSRLKEDLLRATAAAFGQRYLFDVIVPGGVAVDVSSDSARALADVICAVCAESAELRTIYDEHEGVRERFTGAGRLEPQLAAQLGVLGLVGRASGQGRDARRDLPCLPYTKLTVTPIVLRGGDVAARVAVRFDEVQQCGRLLAELLAELPHGECTAALEAPADGAFGIGLIEGWRGPVLVALKAGPAGTVRFCHPHDPSWQNWPALEYAILGNIVPDFPLINKSFNLSYSGVDL
ncbi:MAG: Ni,Fe-hydrogenase III large subunit [Gammaproteobacteria bacterium]|nr:Ni,Fe-hydrogenase III large subunit [Gammaproteobacteria bacterium]